ncbi:glycoside hydrolase family 5 protein [Paenibacillus sp. NFR01]|uniref:glycoside hydrolase family 5 protein n=1 Tax=Paenibacillus sp. NFR01 TaxID=1566279 RepID=UPI0008C6F1E1|nr:cellulase family glycosylhydrolase [Paenibacillus sp. NFR01]SET58525.1 Cellulase (glycosyl hydrolase family 5) [Paenibacillus sp. NFR01]
MFERTDRRLVKGYLRAEGRKVVNGDGNEIVLAGWGLGNWLLPEGYMWLASGTRFDRQRRMETVIRELAGEEYAGRFWKGFRERYVTREDIRRMAELGYNSVRIPFNWRVLMEEAPGINFKEDGFRLLDRCLDWCEEFGIYAFLDMHGAPGGQTGANIDDSVDEFPRLYTDGDSWHKAIELWKEIARRYKDRWIVGGYDLLNEPVRPGLMEGTHEIYLVQRLVDFYETVIPAIRAIDPLHLLSVEGHHWATQTGIFYKRYDDNMVIHFHRYACPPGMEAFRSFLEVSEKLDQPLWLGESGENLTEWFAALFPLSVSLGIGYNLWPWKKMESFNSPLSVRKPEGWDEFLAYTTGGPHPGFERAQQILDQYLEHMLAENCVPNPTMTNVVFRQPGTRLRATDFDQFPGKGHSYSGRHREGNLYGYRADTGMRIVPLNHTPASKRFFFDCGWDLLALELGAGEYAAYSFTGAAAGIEGKLELVCKEDALLTVQQNGVEILHTELTAEAGSEGEQGRKTLVYQLIETGSGDAVINVAVERGVIELHSVSLG